MDNNIDYSGQLSDLIEQLKDIAYELQRIRRIMEEK